MSGSDLRPKSYGWVDKNNVNSYTAALDIPESASGYDDGAIPPAEKYNMVMQRHAGWAAHLDSRAMRSEHIMGSAAYSRISASAFSYTPGATLAHEVAADSCYVVQGYIVDLPIKRMEDEGLSKFIFTANKWTHFYISKDGVSFAVVNIGVAATPGVGQKLLGTAATDGVSLTAWAAGDAAFTTRRVIFVSATSFQSDMTLVGDLSVTGLSSFTGSMILTGSSSFTGNLSLTGRLIATQSSASATVTGINTGAGDIFSATMTGATAGNAYKAVATASSSGSCFESTVPAASSSRGLLLTHGSTLTRAIEIAAAGSTGVEAMSITTTRGVALRLTDTGPLGVPLIVTPRGAGPTEAGSIYIDNTTKNLRHIDSSLVERNNWNSVTGVSAASQVSAFTLAISANNAGTVVVQSVNYPFVAGQRYWVEMACEVGRFTGSTRNLQVSAQINGSALSFSGFTVELFQAGGATQLERYFRRRILYTAVATGTFTCLIQFSVSGGAGAWNYGSASIGIEGHYD